MIAIAVAAVAIDVVECVIDVAEVEGVAGAALGEEASASSNFKIIIIVIKQQRSGYNILHRLIFQMKSSLKYLEKCK